jgi:anti-sigma-K factor RskA
VTTIDQDKDVLAAEYVLGTLSPDERAEAQAMIAVDTAFADVVRGWERRLGELSAMVDPAEPPSDMWGRIKAGITVAEQAAPKPEPTPESVPEAPVEAPAVSAAPPGDAADALKDIEARLKAVEAKPEAGEAKPQDSEVKPPAAEVPAAPAPRPSVLAPPVAVAAADKPARSADVIAFSRRVNRWRTATGVSSLLAACLAVLLVMGTVNPDALPGPLRPKQKVVEVVRTVEVPAPAPAEFVAVFQKDDASPQFLLTFDLNKRQFTVRRVGAEPQAGKSYELWMVSEKFGSEPRSLGVIGSANYTVRTTLPEYDPVTVNRATFGISLEPEGGSPTGRPTEVLYHGKLLQTTPPEFPSRTP